jgi:hypothetical protein
MIKNILIVVMFVILCVLGFHSCNLESNNSKQQKDLVEALLNNEGLKKTIDSKNREITEVKAIVVSKDKDIQNALKEIDRLKSLDAKIVFKTRTKYDTMSIVLRDTVVIRNTDTIASKKFDFHDKWLSLSGLVQDDSLHFDSIAVNNKYTIEVGSVRKGLFKKEKAVFIINENPYSQTTEAQTFILNDQKKWYERGILKFVGGGAVAFMLLAL